MSFYLALISLGIISIKAFFLTLKLEHLAFYALLLATALKMGVFN